MKDRDLPIPEAIVIYLQDCRVNEQEARTIEGKRSMLGLFTKWHVKTYGDKLSDITDETIDAFRHYLIDYQNPQTKKSIGKATRRNKLTAIKTFCHRMYELKYFEESPAARMRLPKRPKTLPKGILQPNEVNAIAFQTTLHGLLGIRDRAIVEVYFACGIRRNELANLKLSSVNPLAEVLIIEQGKGEKDRVVPIAESALHHIDLYLKQVRPQLLTFKSGNALFLNNQGLPFTGSQLSALIKKYKQRAGVDKPGACNLYRHTTATTMLDNGADIRVIQEMLGHASITTTQIYTHVAIGKLKKVYKATHPAARK